MKAFFVVGLGFGDEGKGSIVDSLTRETGADLIVRFNGGAQAAHHVVTTDGREHCFSQFGSGTLAGARTHLSRFMMIEPLAMIREAAHLIEIGVNDPFSLLTIDPDALILTPYHRAMNRIRELARGKDAHGSCGIGIGELASDVEARREVLTMRMLLSGDRSHLLRVLYRIRERLFATARNIVDTSTSSRWSGVNAAMEILELFVYSPDQWLNNVHSLRQQIRLQDDLPPFETAIFEGAQGVLLDQTHGFHPHTTWSDCTFNNAQTLLTEARLSLEVTKIGVTRAYATRHGAGPLPTEDAALVLPERHNGCDGFQGAFRLGHLDLVMLNRAIEVLGGVDMIALTCADRLDEYCVAIGRIRHPYHEDEEPWYKRVAAVGELRNLLIDHLKVPVGIVSRGPTAYDKVYHGEWRNSRHR